MLRRRGNARRGARRGKLRPPLARRRGQIPDLRAEAATALSARADADSLATAAALR